MMIDDMPHKDPQQEAPLPQEAQSSPPEPDKKESDKEYNFRVMRERAERAEQRAIELERSQQRPAVPEKTEDDDISIDDDALIEGKHLKKYIKSLKNDLQQTRQQIESYNSSSVEMRLKSKYSDFESVVSTDNINKLKDTKPALYRSLVANPDLYEKGEAAYEIIKSILEPGKYKQQDEKLEENRSKPRSAANAAPQSSETPLARFGEYDRRVLSEERKDQLRRQVEEAKKFR
jgi:hypothetical protein